MVVGYRESVIVENIRLVCLLELTADFGVKTNAKLTSICQLRDKRKSGNIQSCLFTLILLTPVFFLDLYSQIYNFCGWMDVVVFTL